MNISNDLTFNQIIDFVKQDNFHKIDKTKIKIPNIPYELRIEVRLCVKHDKLNDRVSDLNKTFNSYSLGKLAKGLFFEMIKAAVLVGIIAAGIFLASLNPPVAVPLIFFFFALYLGAGYVALPKEIKTVYLEWIHRLVLSSVSPIILLFIPPCQYAVDRADFKDKKMTFLNDYKNQTGLMEKVYTNGLQLLDDKNKKKQEYEACLKDAQNQFDEKTISQEKLNHFFNSYNDLIGSLKIEGLNDSLKQIKSFYEF